MSSPPARPRDKATPIMTEPAEPNGWLDACHSAGAALAVIALFQALASTLSQVVALRSQGGAGGVGLVQLSGFYGLTVLPGALLLCVPSANARMGTRARVRFLAVALGAAIYIGLIQLVEVYFWLGATSVAQPQRTLSALIIIGDLAISGIAGWLAWQGWIRVAGAEKSDRPYVGAAVVAGCVCAILIQVLSTVGLSSPTNPQAPLTIPPGGRVEISTHNV